MQFSQVLYPVGPIVLLIMVILPIKENERETTTRQLNLYDDLYYAILQNI